MMTLKIKIPISRRDTPALSTERANKTHQMPPAQPWEKKTITPEQRNTDLISILNVYLDLVLQVTTKSATLRRFYCLPMLWNYLAKVLALTN